MAEAGVAIAASRLDALHRLVTLIERTRDVRGEDTPFPTRGWRSKAGSKMRSGRPRRPRPRTNFAAS